MPTTEEWKARLANALLSDAVSNHWECTYSGDAHAIYTRRDGLSFRVESEPTKKGYQKAIILRTYSDYEVTLTDPRGYQMYPEHVMTAVDEMYPLPPTTRLNLLTDPAMN